MERRKFSVSWVGIFTILILFTIGFTLLSYSGYGDKDLSKQITLILISIIAGGIVTKFTTSSWQITKEKLEIKRNILTNYESSYKLIGILSDNFVYRVVESYIKYKATPDSIPFDDYTNKENEIEAFLELDKKPIKKFKDEYDKLKEKLQECSIIKNKVMSDFRLYFGNDEIETKSTEITSKLNARLDIINRLMFSETIQELKKYFDIYGKQSVLIKTDVKNLEKIMVDLKFREINL